MFFYNVPQELFEIAASFKDTNFVIDSIGLLELNEFQMRICLKNEDDFAIYARFIKGQEPIISFGEALAGTYTDNFTWTSCEEVIKKFSNWYFEMMQVCI